MTVIRWIFALIIVALVGKCTVSALQPRVRPPTDVQTAKATRTTLTRTVSGAGKLEPASKVNVSSNITGVLLDLKVGIGSQVKKGDYLGQIDTSRYLSLVAQQRSGLAASKADSERAKSNLAKLKRDAQRLSQLADRDAIGLSDLEQANAAVRGAEAELLAADSRAQGAAATLQEAAHNVEWATLKAPVDGTVLSVNHRVGERLRGSDFSEDVVLVIGSVANMEVKIEVGEHDIVFIKQGQRANIEIDALPDTPISGHVLDLGRDAIVKNAGTDNEVTTFPVWVTLDNPPATALSGMSARVDIYTDTRSNVLAVPIQSVTVRPPGGPGPGGPGPAKADATPAKKDDKKDAGKPDVPPTAAAEPTPAGKDKLEKVVFVVKDGKVSRRKIATGLASDTMIEITDGLAEGEELVEGPYRVLARQLQDGDVVAVEKPGGPGGPAGQGGWAVIGRKRKPSNGESGATIGTNGNGNGAHTNAPLLELDRVSRRYQMGSETIHALRDVSFTVHRGEYVAIIGTSGSGKSTLLNLLGCLDTPTDGAYRLRGRDVKGLDDDALSDLRNREIGFIFQTFQLLPRTTALENVELPLVYRGMARGKRREQARRALERVGLGKRMNHRPNELSGGQRQRVAIARALCAEPTILLADEPTGNLDSATGRDILGLFEQLHQAGNTIVLVTHEPSIAARCPRAIRLSDGQIVHDGPGVEVAANIRAAGEAAPPGAIEGAA